MKHEVLFETGHNCIVFKCAWDSDGCIPHAGGSHGVSGMGIRFLVHGDKGSVQFSLYTGWTPFHSKPDTIGVRNISRAKGNLYPLPADLGYHSREPMYKGQTSMGPCKHLGGADCYYDGSGLNANDAYYTLVNAGIDDLWRFLEEYYEHTFGESDYPAVGEYRKPLRKTAP